MTLQLITARWWFNLVSDASAFRLGIFEGLTTSRLFVIIFCDLAPDCMLIPRQQLD